MKAKQKEYSIADYIVGSRKVKQTFFNKINSIIDWKPIRQIIEKVYTKGRKRSGRPCRDSLLLFKVELLRRWYGLSDYEVENQVNDRLSFSAFVGIGMNEGCPDSTTICRFRSSLVKGGVYDELIDEVSRQLEANSITVKPGTIADAAITKVKRRERLEHLGGVAGDGGVDVVGQAGSTNAEITVIQPLLT